MEKKYILLGSEAIERYLAGDFKGVQSLIRTNSADIISYDKDVDDIDELLQQLEGWNKFTVIDEEEADEIASCEINLTITKDRFLDWYFSYGEDTENSEIRRDISNRVINELYSKGKSEISVEELFDNCNKHAIISIFTEELEDEGIELSDLGCPFTIILKK